MSVRMFLMTNHKYHSWIDGWRQDDLTYEWKETNPFQISSSLATPLSLMPPSAGAANFVTIHTAFPNYHLGSISLCSIYLVYVPSSIPVTVTWPRRPAPTAASAWSSPSTAPRAPKWRHALTKTVHWPFLWIRLHDNITACSFSRYQPRVQNKSYEEK